MAPHHGVASTAAVCFRSPHAAAVLQERKAPKASRCAPFQQRLLRARTITACSSGATEASGAHEQQQQQQQQHQGGAARDLLSALQAAGTKLVFDSADVALLRQHKDRWGVLDATPTASLLLAAAQEGSAYHKKLASDSVRQEPPGRRASSHEVTDPPSSGSHGGESERAPLRGLMARAMDCYAVSLGADMLSVIPGRVSTEIDARFAYNTVAIVEQAKGLIDLYEKRGVDRQRVLIKVAATWEGIEAVRILESQHDIRCNCTLVFAVAQAAACAEAGATLISPFVGRITDWYAAHEGRGYADTPEADPGVLAVTAIYDHLKDPTTGLGRTEIMAASLRNAGQVRLLAGCDAITLSPQLLDELASLPPDGALPARLTPEAAAARRAEKERRFGPRRWGVPPGGVGLSGRLQAVASGVGGSNGNANGYGNGNGTGRMVLPQQQEGPEESSGDNSDGDGDGSACSPPLAVPQRHGVPILRTKKDFKQHMKGMPMEKLAQGVELFSRDAAALETLLMSVLARQVA